MSLHAHIVGNTRGSDDKLAVILQGELIYNDALPNALTFKELLDALNGVEFVDVHHTDDTGILDPMSVAYPED